MAEIKWIKIVTDVFDDEKILMIESMPEADSIIVIWFKLLCLAGKQNNSGVFMMGRLPYTDEMFATIFRRPINTVRLALKVFQDFDMIEVINDTVTIPNWDRHQSLDAYERKKERDRLYMAERRAAQKEIAEKSSDSRLTVARQSFDESSDVVSKIRRDKEKIRKEVEGEGEGEETAPPSLQQIEEYITSRGLNVNPDRFYNYYSNLGWKTTQGTPIVWTDKLEEWSSKEKQSKPTGSGNPFLDRLRQGGYDDD